MCACDDGFIQDKKGNCLTLPPASSGDGTLSCPSGMSFVAGGSFQTGDLKQATVPSVCLDQLEVTVERYEECVRAGQCTPASGAPEECVGGRCKPIKGMERRCNLGQAERANHPVNCVDHAQAVAYCRYLGKRLPTKLEWEYAARCGPAEQHYPWGDDFPDETFACFMHQGGTCPVSSFPAGAYGLRDMAGNVAEWTGHEPLVRDPRLVSPDAGAFFGTVGGAWRDTDVTELYGFHMVATPAGDRLAWVGFRCAKTPAESKDIANAPAGRSDH